MKKIIAALVAAVLASAFMVAGAGAKSGSSAATLSGLDKTSLQTSMQGDLFEIAGGNLALKKSHTPAVVALARRLIKDHSKSFKDAAKLAREFGVEVEKSPTPSEVWELLTVAKVSGATFDRWYTSLEVYDHVQDIQETTDEIKDGSNPQVVSDAKQELPMLKMHLKLSKSALRKVK